MAIKSKSKAFRSAGKAADPVDQHVDQPGATAAQVLAMLQKRRDSVENLAIDATWEQYDAGKPSGWEEGSIYRDNHEQIRVRYHWGPGIEVG